MNTIELARKLGAAIQQEPDYIRYHIAKQANDEDEALQQAIAAFDTLRTRLNAEMAKDARDDEKITQLNSDLRAQYTLVMSNPNMTAYREAKAALDEKVNYINAIISLSVSGEDPETCEPTSACGPGGCAGCKGCS